LALIVLFSTPLKLYVVRALLRFARGERHRSRYVACTDAQLSDIYLSPRVMKSDLYLVSKMNVGRNVFDTIDPKSAQRKRRMIGMPLAERSLRNFGPTISGEISIFLEAIRDASETGEPLDMSERCSWLAGDIVGQMAFGYKLKQQTEVTNRWLQPGMTMSSFRINTYMQAPVYFKLEPMLKFLLQKVRARYVKIIRAMIDERIAMKKDAIPDLYSHVVDHMGGEDGLDWDELWAEALLFILAGSTTTACAISGLFFYLSRYPECYKKLATEIRSSFDNVNEIDSGEKLRQCEYLRACVNETLRLAPPASGLAWRQQIPGDKNPLVVDGHFVPSGTHLSVNLYAINHNERYFPDPFEFRPERWLEGGAPKEIQDVMQKGVNALLGRSALVPWKVAGTHGDQCDFRTNDLQL